MSHDETQYPLTELCERAWKLLHRDGTKAKNRGDDIMMLRIETYDFRSRNRHLWIEKAETVTPPVMNGYPNLARTPVFSVDEEGKPGKINVLECAYLLEILREQMVLDDLAELG